LQIPFKGRYEYKFLVDGRWMIDDSCPKTDNQMGTQNNVMSIDEEDFAVANNIIFVIILLYE
jgi:hypothetical protein